MIFTRQERINQIRAVRFFFSALVVLLCPTAKAQEAMNQKLKITIGERVMTAVLNKSKASQDFIALLPLTLTLEDYNGTEKISNLPKKLSKEGAPAGFDPSIGDITYYALWGNLAIFYKDFSYSSGLVSLGKIESGIEALRYPARSRSKSRLHAK